MTASYATSGHGRFVEGFVLGLLVLPLTVLLTVVVGGGPGTGILAFGALAAGAATLPPVSGSRAGGVAAGIAAEVGLGVGAVAWFLATNDIRFG